MRHAFAALWFVAGSLAARKIDNQHKSRHKGTIFSQLLVSPIRHNYRLLTYKTSTNLEPKLSFLVKIGFSLADVKREVLKSPIVLAYSLEGRIKPRFDHLVKCSVPLKVRMAPKKFLSCTCIE